MATAYDYVCPQLPSLHRHPANRVGAIEKERHTVIVADISDRSRISQITVVAIGVGQKGQGYVSLLLIGSLYS